MEFFHEGCEGIEPIFPDPLGSNDSFPESYSFLDFFLAESNVAIFGKYFDSSPEDVDEEETPVFPVFESSETWEINSLESVFLSVFFYTRPYIEFVLPHAQHVSVELVSSCINVRLHFVKNLFTLCRIYSWYF